MFLTQVLCLQAFNILPPCTNSLNTCTYPTAATVVAIGTGGGGVVVVASVLILVLCIIKVKKLKVDARKSGMHKYTVLKEFIIHRSACVMFTAWSNIV